MSRRTCGTGRRVERRCRSASGSRRTLSDIQSPHVDLSLLSRTDGPFALVCEPFHYLALPNPRDLTCTVIKALGDKFDFLACYADFRVDNQETGSHRSGTRWRSERDQVMAGASLRRWTQSVRGSFPNRESSFM